MSMQLMRRCIGGTRAYTSYSGAAGQAVSIWSGPGVLNTLQIANFIQSGLGVNLLDCAPQLVVSGLQGFAGSSGYNMIGNVPSCFNTTFYSSGSFTSPSIMDWQRPMEWGIVFNSGLAFSAQSGCHAFTVTFTPGKVSE